MVWHYVFKRQYTDNISFNMDGDEQPYLQIQILKHILRMHKHDFCGEQSIYIYARYWQITKYVCMRICGGGGARTPQPPPPPPPSPYLRPCWHVILMLFKGP